MTKEKQGIPSEELCENCGHHISAHNKFKELGCCECINFIPQKTDKQTDKKQIEKGCGKENIGFGFLCGDNGVLCPECQSQQESRSNKELIHKLAKTADTSESSVEKTDKQTDKKQIEKGCGKDYGASEQ